MKGIIESFEWHSSLGIPDDLLGVRKLHKVANIAENRKRFIKAGDNFLVHKATRALWKISKDGKSIEALFDSDLLEEEDEKKQDKE